MPNENPSLSRLGRREPPTMSGNGEEGMKTENKIGDHMHEAAESMHKAEPHSKHMIVSHDGLGMKSHTVDEDGKHEEHDHDNIEDLKGHLGKFFDEEENEGHEGHDGGEEPEENSGNLY